MIKKVLVLMGIFLLLLVGCNDSDTTNSDSTEVDSTEPETTSLLELNDEEMEIYNEFKENYDESVLQGVEPLSVCKMYFYASTDKDYETQYELYIKDEEYVQWSKEEHLSFSESDRMKEFDQFEKVEDLKVDITDSKHANVNWIYGDDFTVDGNPIRMGFNLVKNKEGVWKVHFMPMQ